MYKLISRLNNNRIIIPIIVFIAVFIRIYFFVGHIFSDDAYYSKLSQIILTNEPISQYQGYPIFKLRLLFILGNSLIMKVFGVKEVSTIILPFIFSILNLFLVYIFAKKLFNNKTSLIAMILVAFFPTDVVFATISFPDSINVFLINLGLLFLYKATTQNNLMYSIAAGFLFSFSLLFKENLIYYFTALLIILSFTIIKKDKSSALIFISLLIIVLFFLLESFTYKLFTGNFLYRYSILEENYKYSFYDFFPYSVQKLTHSNNYVQNLALQIILNLKYIFLRRFYLFLPLIALIISFINIFRKENLLISIFFLLLSSLLILFTTDLTFYRPLNLERSWYFFPLLLPSVLVASVFLEKLKFRYILPILLLYLVGSLNMTTVYQQYFNREINSEIKYFISKDKTHKIYTDHFTKYSIDLLSGDDTTAINFSDKFIDENLIDKNSYLLYNEKHIDELNLQGYKFLGLSELLVNNVTLINSFGDFKIYKKK